MSDVTDKATEENRVAWDSFRRQRDAGLVDIRPDSAANIQPDWGRRTDALQLDSDANIRPGVR